MCHLCLSYGLDIRFTGVEIWYNRGEHGPNVLICSGYRIMSMHSPASHCAFEHKHVHVSLNLWINQFVKTFISLKCLNSIHSCCLWFKSCAADHRVADLRSSHAGAHEPWIKEIVCDQRQISNKILFVAYIEVCKTGVCSNYRHKFEVVKLDFQKISDVVRWKYRSRRIASMYDLVTIYMHCDKNWEKIYIMFHNLLQNTKSVDDHLNEFNGAFIEKLEASVYQIVIRTS